MITARSVIIVVMLLLLPAFAHAEWSRHADQNNPVCTEYSDSDSPKSISDGVGGAIIVWADLRNGYWKLFAQRLDAEGDRLWAVDGVEVCPYTSTQRYFDIATDMAGGVFVVWEDQVSAGRSIYSQRLSPDGSRMWTEIGIAVCFSTGDQEDPVLTSDGYGGAIVTWEDERSGNKDIYVQRFDASHTRLWDDAGVVVCDHAASQYTPRTVDDGGGGVVVAWTDERSDPCQVYVRRVNSSGTPLWADDGILAGTGSRNQFIVEIVKDGTGGFILGWEGVHPDDWDDQLVYAQRLNAAGARWWDDGIQLSLAGSCQFSLRLVSDGNGGTFAFWGLAEYPETGLYGQHLSEQGARLWSTDGLLICDAPMYQVYPQPVLDGSGGVIVVWHDYRSDPSGIYGSIYAQRLDIFGTALWETNGSPVNLGTAYYFPTAVSDGQGGSIVAWPDSRNGNIDLFAQRIDDTGYLGVPDPAITAVNDFPNDQGGEVTVFWDASYLDGMPWHALESYSVWMREPGAKAVQPPAESVLADLAKHLQLAPKKIVEYAKTGWTYVQQVPAILATEYSCLAPALGDSSAAGIIMTEYLVIGHGDDPWITWESTPVSGYSVDNLEPGIPQNLVGDWDSPTEIALIWESSGHQDEDLAYYRIYRGEESGFPLEEETLVGQSSTEQFLDDTTEQTWYYRVAAVDAHDNEGNPSQELEVSVTTAVAGIPDAFALHGNRPNPFNPRTVIGFDLPQDTQVTVTIYALDGSRVTTLVHRTMAAGRHEVAWNGCDGQGRPVTTGMYVYRIDAGEFRQTRKMTLVR